MNRQQLFAEIEKEGASVEDIPTLNTLEEWVLADGGCEATDGCWVEVDGTCPDGKRSWMLVLGLV